MCECFTDEWTSMNVNMSSLIFWAHAMYAITNTILYCYTISVRHECKSSPQINRASVWRGHNMSFVKSDSFTFIHIVPIFSLCSLHLFDLSVCHLPANAKPQFVNDSQLIFEAAKFGSGSICTNPTWKWKSMVSVISSSLSLIQPFSLRFLPELWLFLLVNVIV